MLPLLLRHLDIAPSQVTIVTPRARHGEADENGVRSLSTR